jgi:hypothetical protein
VVKPREIDPNALPPGMSRSSFMDPGEHRVAPPPPQPSGGRQEPEFTRDAFGNPIAYPPAAEALNAPAEIGGEGVYASEDAGPHSDAPAMPSPYQAEPEPAELGTDDPEYRAILANRFPALAEAPEVAA